MSICGWRVKEWLAGCWIEDPISNSSQIHTYLIISLGNVCMHLFSTTMGKYHNVLGHIALVCNHSRRTKPLIQTRLESAGRCLAILLVTHHLYCSCSAYSVPTTLITYAIREHELSVFTNLTFIGTKVGLANTLFTPWYRLI